MVEGGEIKVVLTLDNKNFTVETVRAGETIRALKRDLETTVSTISRGEKGLHSFGTGWRHLSLNIFLAREALRDFHDIFMALPMGFLKTAGEIERLQKLMQGLSRETDNLKRKAEAAAGVKFVFNLAQNAPFEVKALSDAFVKLKTAGIDPTNGSMQALVDSVAKFGGTSEHLHRASIAIQQMAGKGVISMEELRQQLGEAVPNAMQLMAQGMGMSMSELAKAVSKGTVEASSALKRMFFQMELQNRGAAEDMMNTWSGMVEKLKTKWVLLQNEIASNGFFQEAKDQLSSLLDGFDADSVRNFAQAIGSALADVVKTFSWAKEMITKYGEEIQALLIGLFALKLAGMVKPFESGMTQMTSAFVSGMNKQDAAAQERLVREKIRISQEIAMNEQKARVLRENSAAQMREADMLYKKQAQLTAELELAESKAMSGRIGQQKKIALLQQEIEATRVATTGIALMGLERGKDAIAIAAENRELQQHIARLDQEAAAHVRAATSSRLLGGAKEALKGIVTSLWGSIKGFSMSLLAMGAQFAAITLAVEAVIYIWDRLGQAAKRNAEEIANAQRAIENYKAGTSKAGDEIDLEKRIAKNSAKLESMIRDTSSDRDSKEVKWDLLDGKGEQVFAQSKLIEALRERMETDARLLEEINAKIAENKAGEAIQNYQRKISHEINVAAGTLRSEYAELQSRQMEVQKQFADDPVGMKTAQAELTKQLDAINRKQIDAEVAVWDRYIVEQRKVLVDAKNKVKGVTDDQVRIASELISYASNKKQELFAKYQQGNALQDRVLINKAGDGKGGGGKGRIEREDPLIRALEMQEAQLAEAEAKLEHLIAQARGFNELKQEAAFEVLGKVASGKYDTAIKDGEGNNVGTKFMGGKDERKSFVDGLRAHLTLNNGDISGYIESLSKLTAAEKEFLKQEIENAAKLAESQAMYKAISEAQKLASSASAEYQQAVENYNSGGLATQTNGMKNLIKHFEQLGATISKDSEKYKEFLALQKKAIADQAGADALNWAAEKQRELVKAEIDAIETVSEKREFEHQQNIERIEREFEVHVRAIEDALKMEELSSEKRTELENSLQALKEGHAKARAAEDLKFSIASRSELDKLLITWSDTTEQMNKASATWANNFIDMVTKATETGKFEFKGFIQSILNDLKRMAIQGTFAALLKGAFNGVINISGNGNGQGGGVSINTGGLSLGGNGGNLITQGVSYLAGYGGNQAFASGLTNFGNVGPAQQAYYNAAGDAFFQGNDAAMVDYVNTGDALGAGAGIGSSLTGALSAYGLAQQYGAVGGFLGGTASTAIAGGAGALLSGGSFMSGAMGALAAIPGWGWALMGIAALLGGMGQGGGPKVEGGWSYGIDGSGNVYDNLTSDMFTDDRRNNRGHSANSTVANLVQETMTSAKNMVESLGGSLKDVSANLFFNSDPEGDAPDTVSSSLRDKDGNLIYSHANSDVARGEYQKELANETKRLLIASVDAANINPVFETIVHGIDLAVAKAEELDAVLNQLGAVNNAMKADQTGILSSIAEKLGQLDATPMLTFLDSVVALINTGFSKSIADLDQAIADSNRSLWATYNAQQSAIGDLITKFDGSTAATANLANGLSVLGQTTMNVLAAIRQASADTHQSIQDSIRTMRMSVLDDQGKYNFLEQETQTLRNQLRTALDPELIQQYADRIRQNAMENFNLIPEAQRAAYLQQYESILNQTDELAQQRYAAARAQMQEERTDNANAIKGAIEQALDNWIARQAEVTAAQASAAQTQAAAANTFSGAVSNFAFKVNDEIGGG